MFEGSLRRKYIEERPVTGCYAGRQEVGRCHIRGESQRTTSCTPLPSANNADHSGFETLRKRHQKSKTGVSVAPEKGLTSTKNCLKKELYLCFTTHIFRTWIQYPLEWDFCKFKPGQ